MAIAISAKELEGMKNQVLSYQRKAESVKERGEEIASQAIQTLEVSGAAYGTGIVRGYMGEPVEVMGIPAELLLAGVGHGASYLKALGKYSEHGHNLSDGVLAGYLAILGVGHGAELREKGGLFGKSSGDKTVTAGGGFSPAQIPGPPVDRSVSAVTADELARAAAHQG